MAQWTIASEPAHWAELSWAELSRWNSTPATPERPCEQYTCLSEPLLAAPYLPAANMWLLAGTWPQLFVPLFGARVRAEGRAVVGFETHRTTPILFKVLVLFSTCSQVDVGSRLFYSLSILSRFIFHFNLSTYGYTLQVFCLCFSK